jgi:hypothetical protein
MTNDILMAVGIGFYVLFLAYRFGYYMGRKHGAEGWRYYE